MAKLILVGAGPGDPDLITVKAINALKSADVVLYDALANDRLLTYCKKNVINIFCGKKMGCHYLSQEEINMLIISYAKKYKNIIRLKGGDPFVFGRAQEEIDTAVANGIKVEVIPGVSSCIAAPASQMIPLTCRGINESFWVATGTTKEGRISKDVYLAAQSSATVILLMAMSKLEEIMDIFQDAGKGNIAAAIIQDATTNKDKMAIGTVNDIVYRAQYLGLSNPAVIIIGDVVNLHPSIIKEKADGYLLKLIHEKNQNGL